MVNMLYNKIAIRGVDSLCIGSVIYRAININFVEGDSYVIRI